MQTLVANKDFATRSVYDLNLSMRLHKLHTYFKILPSLLEQATLCRRYVSYFQSSHYIMALKLHNAEKATFTYQRKGRVVES